MSDKSKLSCRFLKVEKPAVIDKPAKLVLPKLQSVVELDVLKKELYEKIDSVPVWFDYSLDEQKDLIKRFVASRVNSEDVDTICENSYSEIQGFGAINNLLLQK